MKSKVKKVISAILFCIAVGVLFSYITNIYRPSAGYDRTHIIAFDNMEDLDIVYIGGSVCFVCWQPLRAWNDFGFTSYDYATNGLEGTNIEYMVRHAESRMSPDLYIVDVRPYQLWSEEGSTGALRYVTDSWNLLSPNRYSLINSFFNKHNREGDDYWSYVFDIAKYHDNSDVLKTPENWHFKTVHETAPNLGWEWIGLYQYLPPPAQWETDKRTELIDGSEGALRELCRYCEDNEIEVLFVVNPYYIERQDEEMYNTINDIVSEYGFNFLNTNEYYEEIGIDFSTDFYNRRHVNCYGAEKYTIFLGNYIKNNYDIADHHGETAYRTWDDEYLRFSREEETYKQCISDIMKNDLQGFEMAEKLVTFDDISSWYLQTNSDRYTLFIYDNRKRLDNYNNTELNSAYRNWGISSEANCCYVFSEQVIECNAISADMCMEGVVGKDSPNNGISYSISEGHMTIDGFDYYCDDGLTIVAVDNNLEMVADSINIEVLEDQYIIKRSK